MLGLGRQCRRYVTASHPGFVRALGSALKAWLAINLNAIARMAIMVLVLDRDGPATRSVSSLKREPAEAHYPIQRDSAGRHMPVASLPSCEIFTEFPHLLTHGRR